MGVWSASSRRPAKHRPSRPRPARRLHVESLEDRLCPSGGYLYVDSLQTNSVLRYDETTGAFAGEFVKKNSGGLGDSVGMDFGPDHNLYVSNGGPFPVPGEATNVLRFDGVTGASLGVFADGGQITSPRSVVFGPDGNLYVADGNGPGQVLRFSGTTGAFLDTFVHPGSGGLSHPSAMLFGPDGNLYVIATDQSEVLRYNGQTGAFMDTFITPGSGGLTIPVSMAFGPDGNLYVANTHLNDTTPGGVLRYNGRTGAFTGMFIAPRSGGLIKPLTVLFGPEGDLYVGSADAVGISASPHTSTVLRYDGTTGAFRGTFVTADNGKLRYPSQLLFTETDPTTLSYDDPRPALVPALATSATRPLAPSALIGTLAASPNQVTAGSNLTLIVSNITDANPCAGITQVAFYVHINGADTLLGYGAQTGPRVWIFTSTTNLPPRTYTLIAQAEESEGVIGDPLAITLNVL
jgi:streptogramin lyase